MNNQDNLIQNSLNMWRQLGESTGKSMIALFEKNLEQSKNYQLQMQKVFNQVVANQFDLIFEGVKTLESQTDEFVKSWDEMTKVDSE